MGRTFLAVCAALVLATAGPASGAIAAPSPSPSPSPSVSPSVTASPAATASPSATPDPAATAPVAAPSTAPAPVASAVPSPSPSTAAPVPSATAPAPAAPVLTSVSRTAGSTTDEHRVVLVGRRLDAVTAVLLGAAPLAPVVHLSATRLAVRVPTAPGFRAASAGFVLKAGASVVRTGVRYRWVATTGAAREMRWVWTHARAHAYTWGHAYIPFEDCANFTSHALVVRGLPGSVLTTSSTALRALLVDGRGDPELADSPAARRRVRVGDVVQFDWHPRIALPFDRDHSGIVSAVVRNTDGSITVRYIAHTDPGDQPQIGQTVEGSLREPGHDPKGKVFFILIR